MGFQGGYAGRGRLLSDVGEQVSADALPDATRAYVSFESISLPLSILLTRTSSQQANCILFLLLFSALFSMVQWSHETVLLGSFHNLTRPTIPVTLRWRQPNEVLQKHLVTVAPPRPISSLFTLFWFLHDTFSLNFLDSISEEVTWPCCQDLHLWGWAFWGQICVLLLVNRKTSGKPSNVHPCASVSWE